MSKLVVKNLVSDTIYIFLSKFSFQFVPFLVVGYNQGGIDKAQQSRENEWSCCRKAAAGRENPLDCRIKLVLKMWNICTHTCTINRLSSYTLAQSRVTVNSMQTCEEFRNSNVRTENWIPAKTFRVDFTATLVLSCWWAELFELSTTRPVCSAPTKLAVVWIMCSLCWWYFHEQFFSWVNPETHVINHLGLGTESYIDKRLIENWVPLMNLVPYIRHPQRRISPATKQSSFSVLIL